jgi:SAM-dependent methyltransferase
MNRTTQFAVTQKMSEDVPSPVDLRLADDAREWEQSAMSKRPWRVEFFERFACEIRSTSPEVKVVLELGSGPGFLAEHLLRSLNNIEYVLLDFSAAMHTLARARLGELARRAIFIERSFKDENWPHGLGTFQCVVIHQAIHELRHKRYAPQLHAHVASILAPGGVYLVCDHFTGEGGMKNEELFMSIAEQELALRSAGFSSVHLVMAKGGLVLHRAAQPIISNLAHKSEQDL